jgi:predicted transcriptional regulator
MKKEQNLWASFEKELSIKSGRPEGDWKTIDEVAELLGVERTTAGRRVRQQIKEGAMEKTTRLYNRNITAFYRPISKK